MPIGTVPLVPMVIPGGGEGTLNPRRLDSKSAISVQFTQKPTPNPIPDKTTSRTTSKNNINYTTTYLMNNSAAVANSTLTSRASGKRRARSASPSPTFPEPAPKPSNKRVRGVKPDTQSSSTTSTTTPSSSNYNLRHRHPSQASRVVSSSTASTTVDRPKKPEPRLRPSTSSKSTTAMPRKHRTGKAVISAGNLKEKANASSHTAPSASTSNPASVPATAKSSEQDVDMNAPRSISSDRHGNDGTDHTSGLSTSDHGANDESQDDQDSRSNSEADDPDLAEEHGGIHDDFGDDLDPEQASLHDDEDDDDDDMDESEMAALRASEALFGFDRASTTTRGVGGGSGGALAGLDAMGISGLRGLGGIMAGFTHRLKNILQSLKARGSGSSTSRLAALQELAEILAVSTEDTLAGYLQTDSFARELVAILRGESDHNESEDEEDEVALVAALTATASSSSSYNHPSSGTDVEQMLLASRCLANLMEALPGSAHTVVHHGAVPVLCAKLLEINFIDLAEQSLSTLEKISEELPSSIVREGGLTALLQYLDFFSTNVQRTAVTAAANCCSSISSESFEMVRDVFPILRNILSYSDQRVSEQAVLAITRVTDSYRHHPDKLQQLLTPDVLSSLTALLSPVGGTKISDNIFSAILKSFTNIGRSSPEVAANLLDAGLADTVYGILIGQTPPEIPDEHDLALELTSNSSVITQALMRKDRNQIQQAIDLVVEVLPPLPKTGTFDPKLAKRPTTPHENVAMKDEEATSTSVTEAPAPSNEVNNSFSAARSLMDEDVKPDISARTLAALAYSSSSQIKESNKEAATAHRIELLQSTSREQVVRRFNALLLPTLLEVYGASVSSTIRLKALVAVLKIAYFSKAEYLTRTLKPIPLASFLASILANRDQNSLVMYALQMVDLLLAKLPDDYDFIFRREGVMHEVNRLAESTPTGSSIKTRISNVPVGGSRSESHISAASNLLDEELLQVPSSLGRHSSSIHAFSSASTSSSPTSTKDQLIYRARHLKAKCVMAETTASIRAQEILDNIRDVVNALGTVQTNEEAKLALAKLAALFSRENDPVTSFELLESGLVEGLLRFATESRSFGPPLNVRSELLSETFFSSSEDSPAFLPLVKRLQESLGRLEGFEVLTAVASTPDDSRRSTASMLARQLKIRLVAAEGTDVPRNCANVVVSIHAIATFQAFNDYLRPRIIKAQDDERHGRPSGSSTSRLSGMLAAFAAVAGLPASSSSSTPSSHLEDSGFSLPSRVEAAESSTSSSLPAVAPDVPPVNAHAPRRSSRLSGRGLTAEDLDREAADPPLTRPSSSTVLSTSAPTQSMEVDTPRRDRMEVDDEQRIEGSPIDQEMSSRPSNIDEPPVSVQPAQDGSKMEAHTPHGTRIATPLGSRPSSALRKHSNSSLAGLVASGAGRSSKPSYAAAVKAEPKDWHLAFSLGGQSIPLDTTVYGAVYANESQSGLQSRNMWTNVYTVTFRKVDGPEPPSNEDASSVDPESREEGLLPASILEGSQQASILRLLRALHSLNLDWHELRNSADHAASSLAFAESAFINNKLTAKLNRQLEEPMIVASACLPDWACELPQQFPFLFPFETRFSFLQSTSFGYARLIQKWVGQARSDSSRRDENLGLLGRLQRQKVRISRQKILESLIKVFELYSSCRAMLEVEYFDEVGTGLGPTLEFFSLASKAFAEKQYHMWRDHESDSQSLHVFSRTGLFPSPMDDRTAETEKGIERLRKFKVLGQFMAKALMDSRIVDISLSRSFARLVLDYPLPLTIASVGLVDKSLAASLEHLNKYIVAKHAIEADKSLSESEASAAIQQIRIDDATVDDLALEFILPGYDVEMKPDSSETLVTIDNIEEFIELVIYWTLSKGVNRQIEMFKAGFSMVFPIRDLKSFTPDEIVNIFGNAESEDWSPETLTSAMRADHGYNMDSAAIRGLINIMSTYDVPSRRQFLQFITGAPKLPIGGFRGLHPALTVVRKAAEPGHSPDEYLPSVMTCVNYLKLPEYSTQGVAADKLTTAIQEGRYRVSPSGKHWSNAAGGSQFELRVVQPHVEFTRASTGRGAVHDMSPTSNTTSQIRLRNSTDLNPPISKSASGSDAREDGCILAASPTQT
ncbi:hypothetical protein PSTG_01838 [Puccinia striiformis f. sp. tritici PST-78]|uniref:HECT-type E3 ubiquitin transferase n=1 Tax=Puccinia striiformis f. sp. tritici PST-78 TaxID=1165861 RepID=A0A0L0W132_9BASI|nr:hypothetical protein PSTG_01838 [Puccinia striiformis f. sp. tritici PST-78]